MPDGSVTNQRRDGKKSRIIQLSDYVKRMDRVEPKEMQWLWWPYIVGGGVTLPVCQVPSTHTHWLPRLSQRPSVQ